jgi:crotonobetainyl-CoA:carnitine CoA-transferase CaiB-like acyl-CoA transferase
MLRMPERPNIPAYRPSPSPQPKALADVRIVDFSRVLAGPFATQILGDLGAEVIKIEQIVSGDDTRSLLPEPNLGGESFFDLALNRNKRSISIDLRTEEGRKIALDLIATADVVLENFTTRVMQQFGLDYASLMDRFPQLIYCSVSAYGRTGRLANAAGYDSAICMETGVAAMNVMEGEEPVPSGVPFVDITTAMNATIGILAALHARKLHGKGQFIESAMYDTAIADLSYKGYQFLASGQSPASLGRKPKFGVPGGQFHCSDGMVWFTCTGQKMFRNFCDLVVERPDLFDDPRFDSVANRNANFEVLFDLLSGIFATQNRAFWSDRLKRAGIPCGEVRTVGEALMARETAERDMIAEIPHPTAGRIPMIKSPIKMSLTPAVDPTPPPLLGQNSREILRDLLGYDDERIDALSAQGVIQVLDEVPVPHTISEAAA